MMYMHEAIKEVVDGQEGNKKKFFNCKITPRLARLMESERKTENTLWHFRHKPYQRGSVKNENEEDIL